MKNIFIFHGKWASCKILIASIFLISIITQCEIQESFDYEYNNPGGKIDLTSWEYIQQTDSLSLMEEAITIAGLQDYYSGSTEYTFIVPRNSAFRDYMKTNSYTNISTIPVATLQNILKYHIVKARIIFSDPTLLTKNNPIAYDTENGQIMYLSHDSNFLGLINEGTKISWTIITSNIEPVNGVIHVTKDIVYLSE